MMQNRDAMMKSGSPNGEARKKSEHFDPPRARASDEEANADGCPRANGESCAFFYFSAELREARGTAGSFVFGH